MTPEQWKTLPDKARWDITVTLRGPDSRYGETIKWFTSSVIRGQVVEIFNTHGLVNPDLHLVILPIGSEGGKANPRRGTTRIFVVTSA